MRLSITTIKPILEHNTTWGTMSIEQPKGEQNITQIPAKMEIDRELPKVIIDQYQCFAEAGLKNNMDLTLDNTHFAKQKVMEAISRIVSDGDRMASIENHMPEAVPELSEQNTWTPEREFNFDLVPKSRPKIDFTGHLNINWQLGKADINYTPRKPVINHQPSKVEFYLKQRPSIEIRFIDEKI